MKKRRYEYSERATLRNLLIGVGHARKEGRLYVVANLVHIIHQRFHRHDIKLTPRERRQLIAMLHAARHGTVPLPSFIPRGYQVARFLMLTKIHAPGKTHVTSNDTNLIFQAEATLIRDKEKWLSDQLASLHFTCRSIGLTHLF
jgi:hypothetical protein